MHSFPARIRPCAGVFKNAGAPGQTICRHRWSPSMSSPSTSSPSTSSSSMSSEKSLAPVLGGKRKKPDGTEEAMPELNQQLTVSAGKASVAQSRYNATLKAIHRMIGVFFDEVEKHTPGQVDCVLNFSGSFMVVTKDGKLGMRKLNPGNVMSPQIVQVDPENRSLGNRLYYDVNPKNISSVSPDMMLPMVPDYDYSGDNTLQPTGHKDWLRVLTQHGGWSIIATGESVRVDSESPAQKTVWTTACNGSMTKGVLHMCGTSEAPVVPGPNVAASQPHASGVEPDQKMSLYNILLSVYFPTENPEQYVAGSVFSATACMPPYSKRVFLDKIFPYVSSVALPKRNLNNTLLSSPSLRKLNCFDTRVRTDPGTWDDYLLRELDPDQTRTVRVFVQVMWGEDVVVGKSTEVEDRNDIRDASGKVLGYTTGSNPFVIMKKTVLPPYTVAPPEVLRYGTSSNVQPNMFEVWKRQNGDVNHLPFTSVPDVVKKQVQEVLDTEWEIVAVYEKIASAVHAASVYATIVARIAPQIADGRRVKRSVPLLTGGNGLSAPVLTYESFTTETLRNLALQKTPLNPPATEKALLFPFRWRANVPGIDVQALSSAFDAALARSFEVEIEVAPETVHWFIYWAFVECELKKSGRSVTDVISLADLQKVSVNNETIVEIGEKLEHASSPDDTNVKMCLPSYPFTKVPKSFTGCINDLVQVILVRWMQALGEEERPKLTEDRVNKLFSTKSLWDICKLLCDENAEAFKAAVSCIT